MMSIQFDETEVEKRFQKELKKRLDELEKRHTFWDMKELCRQTHMSENTIRETFFFDPRFPKVRIGRKWMMPAKATEEFLLTWLSEQPKH